MYTLSLKKAPDSFYRSITNAFNVLCLLVALFKMRKLSLMHVIKNLLMVNPPLWDLLPLTTSLWIQPCASSSPACHSWHNWTSLDFRTHLIVLCVCCRWRVCVLFGRTPSGWRLEPRWHRRWPPQSSLWPHRVCWLRDCPSPRCPRPTIQVSFWSGKRSHWKHASQKKT